MIEQQGNLFLLSTAHTSLLLRADARAPRLLYLGKKLAGGWENASLLAPEYDGSGNEKPCSFFSAWGGTDVREPSRLLRAEDGSASADFSLRSAEIAPRTPLEGLPSSYGEETCLRLTYEEKRLGVLLALEFTAYEDSDAFTSVCSLKNEGKSTVTIERFASLQLEFWGKDYSFTTFDGDWGCERQKHTRPLNGGKCENASFTGASSPFRAPYTLLTRPGAAVGVNLVYSGNHRTVAESDDMGRTRLITGINPFSFSWKLRGGETFFAPEAVFAFGHSEREVGFYMRAFVQEHIIRGVWKKKPRPVLVNNWEGTYFSFTRERILNIAKAAKEAGAELFVLDDGWFGSRDDDTTSLGDWTDHEEKTGGIASLAEEVRSLGLDFGIWMEPEMVSEQSELYKAHPEWAMKIPGREPVRMRHQLVLDLTLPAVQDYLIGVALGWMQKCGADGWRLDVADEVSHDFWRKFRRAVKAENPQAILIGESWHDACAWLQGDQYDSIMNYSFTKACLDFFAFRKYGAQAFCDRLSEILMRNTDQVNEMMLNLLDSHDTERFLTNAGGDLKQLCNALAVLFFFPGMPCLYYGTEIGMEGGYDPDSRRTFDWNKEHRNGALSALVRRLTKLKREKIRGGVRMYVQGELFVMERGALTLLVNNTDRELSFSRDGEKRFVKGQSHEILERG